MDVKKELVELKTEAWVDSRQRAALDVVIKALEQEPQTFKWCIDCKEYDQEKHCCHRWSKVIRDSVEELKQEPKTGHWIVDGSVDCYLDKVRCHCSECGKKKEFPADYDHIKQELSISYKHLEFIDNFCPNCGAKMEVSE